MAGRSPRARILVLFAAILVLVLVAAWALGVLLATIIA